MSENKLKKVNKIFVPEPKWEVVSVSHFSDSYANEHSMLIESFMQVNILVVFLDVDMLHCEYTSNVRIY